MEYNDVKWKGNDASLSVCLEDYGMVYKYDGENFEGWVTDGLDKEGRPNTFAPFWMDNDCIDEYFDFEDNGEKIAKMCGVTPEEMDYEWKMDALMAYYGSYEFTSAMYSQMTKEELVELIKKEGWNGNLDM